ncbi:MAG: hypothetical protein R3A10_03315 [Caldilineaceae bacterium]
MGEHQFAYGEIAHERPDQPADQGDHGQRGQVVRTVMHEKQIGCHCGHEQQEPAVAAVLRGPRQRGIVAKTLDHKEERDGQNQDAVAVVFVGHPLAPQPGPYRPGEGEECRECDEREQQE